MSYGRFGDSQMMPAAVQDASHGMGYTQQNDPYSQALMDFFGMPSNQTMVQSYQYFPRTNQTLPDAYEGRNLFLNDTIEGLILADNEVYTDILLRWLFTDQIHFTYNTFNFNQTLPSIVPHEGVSRLITSSTDSQTFTSQRRGLAFRMEGDFADTAQGAAQYTRNLIQISQACQEMANYAVELALLNCKDYQREWSAQFRERATTYEKIVDEEAADFGACALEPGRLEVMIEKSRAVLKARRIVADACLLWPQAKLHFTMEMNGSKTGYWRLGPDGNSTFERGPDAMGTIRNIAVWESREFDVNVGGPRAQPLERSTNVGEWYGMLFGSRRSDNLCVGEGDAARSLYKTSQRDIFIYDLPSDNYRRVSFREALLETNVFKGSGESHQLRDEFQDIADELNSKTEPGEAIDEYVRSINKYNSMSGESRSDRTIPIFVVRDTLSRQYKVARTFADLDYDVLTDEDVRQVGETLRCATGAQRTALGVVPAARAFPESTSSLFPLRVQVPTRSPLSVGSYAGLVSGSMPLAESANAFLYAEVTADGKVSLSEEMESSKLNAWLSATMSTSDGKDNESFKQSLNQRNAMLVDFVKGFAKSSPTNIMTVRAAYRKALDDNVKANGTYAKNHTFETLKADVQRVRDSAETIRGSESDAVAGSALTNALVLDTAANPFAKASTQAEGHEVHLDSSKLSSLEREAISSACFNFGTKALAMEGRVLLHGAKVGGVEFNESNAREWASAVEMEAKTPAQRSAAERTVETMHQFVNARGDFENQVKERITHAIVHKDARLASKAGIFSEHASPGGVSRLGDVASFLYGQKPLRTALPFTDERTARARKFRDGKFVGYEGKTYQADGDLGDVEGTGNATRRLDFFDGDANIVGFLNLEINGDNFLKLLDANIHLPFNVLLWRLWIQLKMYTGILMESGYSTGASPYGHSNFAMGAEVATKTITGNFTFYHNAIVWREKAVMHLRNICPRGYEGGWTTRFMTHVGDELNKVAPRQRGSVLSTLMAVTENSWSAPLNFTPTQRVISARGDQLSYMDRVQLFATYSGSAYYAMVHELEDSQQYSFINSRYADEYMQPNTIAHMGAHYVYNSDDNKFNKYEGGSGHLSGNRTGRGVKNVWNGNGRLFPDQSTIKYILT